MPMILNLILECKAGHRAEMSMENILNRIIGPMNKVTSQVHRVSNLLKWTKCIMEVELFLDILNHFNKITGTLESP